MGLRFDPMGGGQFKQALAAIIEAEKVPINSLQRKKVIEESRQKLFQEFKGKFSTFAGTLREIQGVNNLRELKAELGEGKDLIEVSIDKAKAQPGSYDMVIDSMAKRSSMISNGFSSPDKANLGIGYIVMYPNEGETFETYVGPNESNLYAIAKKINDASDSPVRATVIKDVSNPEKPWHLILNAKGDGEGKSVTFPEFYFLDGEDDLTISDARDAQNGVIKVNDYEVQIEGNDVPDFLQGVNLKIKGFNPDKPFQLKIAEDYPKVTQKVKTIVDNVNGVLEFINKQNQIDDKTDTRTTFAGDTSLQTIEYRLRNLFHEAFPTGNTEEDFRWVHMHEIGLQFDKSGKLSLNDQKFQMALEKDFYRVGEAISGENGFAAQLSKVMSLYTRPGDGLLAVREKGFRQRVDQIDRNIEDKQRGLEKKTDSLTQQFSRLQGTLGKLQSQQQYMQATLGGGGGGNLVQQLLGG